MPLSGGSPHPRGDGPCPSPPASQRRPFSPPAWGWSDQARAHRGSTRVLPTRVGMVRPGTGTSGEQTGSPHPRGDGPFVIPARMASSSFSPPAWGWSAQGIKPIPSTTVLPTRVGMVRRVIPRGLRLVGSPHPRGDGPSETPPPSEPSQFSPPAWGWSVFTEYVFAIEHVLPTRVGMVRQATMTVTDRICSPHPRGDGPSSSSSTMPTSWFSPPAWGWSAGRNTHMTDSPVLPTRVGMVRPSAMPAWRPAGSPHPRGDGPLMGKSVEVVVEFSPPAWGWSENKVCDFFQKRVLPTRVGMVRAAGAHTRSSTSSPHPRGDGPENFRGRGRHLWFSPPAWGWSATIRVGSRRLLVLPTRVGMVRPGKTERYENHRSPHPRGDGPISSECKSDSDEFSPPAWGWSAHGALIPQRLKVLPTRVGMVRLPMNKLP